jgi:lipopolysaccharide export system protein LptA
MKKTMLAVLLFLGTPGFAADNAIGLDTGASIGVNAETVTADINAETATFSGNVVIVQGEIRMRADRVEVEAPGGQYSRMEASGNVVVDSPSGTARGTTAVYEVPNQIIRLAGGVTLTKDNNVLSGSNLVVNVRTGLAQLTDQGGRVRGVFMPQQQAPQTPPQTGGNP